jgi:hypothetical protein
MIEEGRETRENLFFALLLLIPRIPNFVPRLVVVHAAIRRVIEQSRKDGPARLTVSCSKHCTEVVPEMGLIYRMSTRGPRTQKL